MVRRLLSSHSYVTPGPTCDIEACDPTIADPDTMGGLAPCVMGVFRSYRTPTWSRTSATWQTMGHGRSHLSGLTNIGGLTPGASAGASSTIFEILTLPGLPYE
eukprot:11913112-Prorocentrum_lima.AAC.1